MVPCDMSDTAELEDVEDLVDRLGPSKVAEMFAKGRKKFLDTLQSMPEDSRSNIPQEMSGKEYKECMEEEKAAFLAAMAEAGEAGESEEGAGDEVELGQEQED